MRATISRIVLTAVAMAVIPTALSAQIDTTWVRRYADSGIDSATALTVDSKGNVYVTGASERFGSLEFATAKYDSFGNLIWREFSWWSGRDEIPADIAVFEGPGGNRLCITGSIKDTTPNSTWDFFSVFVDADTGQQGRSQVVGDTLFNDRSTSVAVDGIGNFFVSGMSETLGTRADFLTIKYDQWGTELWRRRLDPGDRLHDSAVAVSWTDDSSYGAGIVHVTGSSRGGGVFDTTWNFLTVAYDGNGTQLWYDVYDAGGDELAADMAVLAGSPNKGAGIVHVTGSSRGSGTDSTNSDYLTVAYDNNGQVAWTARYDAGPDDQARAIAVFGQGADGAGIVHVTGSSRGSGTDAGDLDYLTVTYDQGGKQQWAARYDGGGDDVAWDIAAFGESRDGSGIVHVTGSSRGSGTDGVGLDYVTIAYNCAGVRRWIHRYDGGWGNDVAVAIGFGPTGNTYVTGFSTGQDSTFDYATIMYRQPPVWPVGWSQATSMLAAPSGRGVKRGGWLALNNSNGLFYAAKGSKVGDFYSYHPVLDRWSVREQIPPGSEGKPPGKGARGIADGFGSIYATKGNNTLGFWRYDIAGDDWVQLPDVPLGASGKRVKGGTDMVYVPGPEGEPGYVYLLKGYRTDFMRYDVTGATWQLLPSAPIGVRDKWDKGSFLVWDEDRTLYAHKAKYYSGLNHEMWTFDLVDGEWSDAALAGMPLMGLHRGKVRRKKSKDGGCGAWWNNGFYALKGGNTQQVYRYDVESGWTESDTFPTGARRVKYGADIASYGCGAFFALKGNKTLELWRFVAAEGRLTDPFPGGPMTVVEKESLRISAAANPVRGDVALIRYVLPKGGPGSLAVRDICGRTVRSDRLSLSQSGLVVLDVAGLSTGLYLVSLESSGHRSVCKLVVQR